MSDHKSENYISDRNACPEKQYLTWQFVKGEATLNPADIVYIENYLHRATFHMRDGTELHIYRKMSDLEADLKDNGFVRTHQSYIVNLQDIKAVRAYRVYLKNGMSFPVPRARFTEVKSLFEEMKGS